MVMNMLSPLLILVIYFDRMVTRTSLMNQDQSNMIEVTFIQEASQDKNGTQLL